MKWIMDVISMPQLIILKASLDHSPALDNDQDCYSSKPSQTLFETTPLSLSKESLLTLSNSLHERLQDAFRTP